MQTTAGHQLEPLTAEHPELFPEARCWRALLILDLVFLAASAVTLHLAPCGAWTNFVVGVEFWQNTDPGGPYVASSLYFFRSGTYPPFPGHPGLTLQLPIAIFARVVYAVAHATGTTAPYLLFWAKNLRCLFIFAGYMIAAWHIISFHALYALARRFVDARAAFLGVLAYATVFFTLYFCTRLSGEPIIVSMFLFVTLSLWNANDALAQARRGRAFAWIALAAICTGCAFFTKIQLGGLLPAFGLLQLLVQRQQNPRPLRRRLRARLVPAGWYVVVAAATLFLWNLKMDWISFFKLWFFYTPGQKDSQAVNQLLRNHSYTQIVQTYWHDASNMLVGFFQSSWHNTGLFFSPRTPQGLFALSEAIFLPACLLGLAIYWRTHTDKRRQLFWPLLYLVVLIPLLAYRGLWHYSCMHLAIGSVFFGFLLNRLLRPPRLRYGILAVVLMHALSIGLVAQGKLFDIHIYRERILPFQQAIDRVPYGHHVAMVGAYIPPIWHMHGVLPQWLWLDGPFQRTCESFFLPLPDGQPLTRDWARENRVDSVLDFRGDTRLVPIDQWDFAAGDTR